MYNIARQPMKAHLQNQLSTRSHYTLSFGYNFPENTYYSVHEF